MSEWIVAWCAAGMVAMSGCGGRTTDSATDASPSDTYAADSNGTDSHEVSVCDRPFPCEGPLIPPDGGPGTPRPCADFDAGWTEYSCERVPPSSTGCVYSLPACPNCAGWCCPPGVEKGPMTDSPIALPDAGAEPPAPPGCVRVTDEDSTCVSQRKPRFAFHCTLAATFANCISNLYPPKKACEVGGPLYDQCCYGR